MAQLIAPSEKTEVRGHELGPQEEGKRREQWPWADQAGIPT